MKNGEAHRVPLCPMALEVIGAARPYSSDSAFVFQSSFKKGFPETVRALSRAIIRHSGEMGFQERFTPHDLRRTMRTRLAELGVSDIVAERVLGHKLQGMLAVYNRVFECFFHLNQLRIKLPHLCRISTHQVRAQ